MPLTGNTSDGPWHCFQPAKLGKIIELTAFLQKKRTKSNVFLLVLTSAVITIPEADKLEHLKISCCNRVSDRISAENVNGGMVARKHLEFARCKAAIYTKHCQTNILHNIISLIFTTKIIHNS